MADVSSSSLPLGAGPPGRRPDEAAVALTLSDIEATAGRRRTTSPGQMLSRVVEMFENDADLPGVLVYQDGRLLTVLSQRAVSHQLAQAFCRELLFDKPVSRLLDIWPIKMLALPAETAISAAITAALARPAEHRYEPVVALPRGGAAFVIDLHLLLAEQCRALESALAELEERRRAAHAAELERDRLNGQLLAATRQAGMAEVATGVLHNVGNVLNSINVSATVVADKLQSSRLPNLGKAVAMIQEHAGDLGEFLTADAKGKQLPDYLARLTGLLGQEQGAVAREVEALARSVEHIKHIVTAQQSYAKDSVVAEPVDLAALLEDAVRINALSLERHGIEVARDFAAAPYVVADKHKVMQILVNLVSNAKKAVRDGAKPDRRIALGLRAVTCDGQEMVRLSVADTGVGIPAENLTRVFTHGFTTSAEGHGFGLHNSANAARQMGGRLTAASDGLGRGAVFFLDLPVAMEACEHERPGQTEPAHPGY